MFTIGHPLELKRGNFLLQVTPVIPVISSSAVMTGNSFNSNQQESERKNA